MSVYLTVAEQLMEKYPNRDFSALEIWQIGRREGLFPDTLLGRTPWNTIKSKISVEIRRNGIASKFVRVAPGRFQLRRRITPDTEYIAPPWAPSPSGESVLALRVDRLPERLRFQGISRHSERVLSVLAERDNLVALDRSFAESTEDYKQLLTYVVVRRGNDVLEYTRGSYNRVEDFLRGARCVGFGGHVTDLDANLFDDTGVGLRPCAIRELGEELELPELDKQRLERGEGLDLVGFINDDSSAVGRRHIAGIFMYSVSGDSYWESPLRGELSIRQLRWIDPSSTGKFKLHQFEYWSQLVIRKFFRPTHSFTSTIEVVHLNRIRDHTILCVVGPIGSGKTEAVNVLTDEYDYRSINSGRILAGLLGVPPVPETSRDEFQAMAHAFISQAEGPRRLAEGIYKQVADGHRFIVDGIRQRATLLELRRLVGRRNTAVVFVSTPPDLAYEFYRRRESRSATISDFLAVRSDPTEAEVSDLIDEADAVIYNWYGAGRYRRVVRSLMGDTSPKERD